MAGDRAWQEAFLLLARQHLQCGYVEAHSFLTLLSVTMRTWGRAGPYRSKAYPVKMHVIRHVLKQVLVHGRRPSCSSAGSISSAETSKLTLSHLLSWIG
jgi:hypothetical protein